MKVHEYQAKALLSEVGVAVPNGRVAFTTKEVSELATSLGGQVVVKAQVHAGGRGKAGGIRLVGSPQEARDVANTLLGSRLVTDQTGADGVPVASVLVEEALEIENEMYVGIVVDGAADGVVVMVSEAGGVDIEQVAARSPEKLLKVVVDPMLGLMPFQARSLAYSLGLAPNHVRKLSMSLTRLYKLFDDKDCSLAEINPMVITAEGLLVAADAKLVFDDDALFRHSDIQQLHDPDQEEPLEAQAGQYDISYVKLDGDVGCIVNGAGLAMATMDVTNDAGASPANFLDVGGGADEAKVAHALKIIFSDSTVRTVLVNVFGGILRCDVVSRGILSAAEAVPDMVRPLVVRMLGTNAEEGRRLLLESGLEVTVVDDLAAVAEAIRAYS